MKLCFPTEISWSAELCHKLCWDHKEKGREKYHCVLFLFSNAISEFWMAIFGGYKGEGGNFFFLIFHSFWGQVLPVKVLFLLETNFCVLIACRLAFSNSYFFVFKCLIFSLLLFFFSFFVTEYSNGLKLFMKDHLDIFSFRNISTRCGVKVSHCLELAGICLGFCMFEIDTMPSWVLAS